MSRHRRREKHRRQYTFTRTKAVIAVILSAILSIIFSSVIDTYQRRAINSGKNAINNFHSSLFNNAKQPKELKSSSEKTSVASPSSVPELDSIEQRLEKLESGN